VGGSRKWVQGLSYNVFNMMDNNELQAQHAVEEGEDKDESENNLDKDEE
jgi:hypothetical protein